MIKILISIVVLVLFSHDAFCSVEITGAVVGSSTITITGSGFGSRTATTPKYWDNFDTDTIGELPPGQITNQSSYGTVEANLTHSGAKSLEFNWQTSETESFQRNVVDIGAGGSDKIFVSMWVYMDKTGTTATDFQLKGVYATSCSDYFTCYDAGSSWAFYNHFWEDTPRWYNGTAAMTYGWNGETMVKLSSGSNPTDAWLWGEWQRVDYYMQRSSVGGATDGVMYWNRVGRSSPMVNETTVSTHYEGNDTWRYVSIVQGVASIAGGILDYDIYVDDVYIDITQARVELCDSSTWAARAHCEIQPSTEWATGEVTATINRGTLPTGNTVYLYVVDDTGVVNENGYQVTLTAAKRYAVRAVTNE